MDGAALALALPLAWALDARFGEPRNAWHPVAWVGRLLGPLGQALTRCQPAAAFIGGALAWCAIALGVFTLAWWLQAQLTARLPWWAAAPLLALLLKPAFAWRMLRDEAAAVEAALQAGDLAAARERAARLVSRDVQAMDATLLRETTLETLAENLNDSVVAPLCWAVLLGLPGAWLYRFANTTDAMWGYRGRWEWAGKWAARADDGLSWLPARLTGYCLHRDLGALRAEARRTPSPNGGWPMGAMALRLGVRLSKPGAYTLNPAGRAAQGPDMARALAAAAHTAWSAAGAATLALAWRAVA